MLRCPGTKVRCQGLDSIERAGFFEISAQKKPPPPTRSLSFGGDDIPGARRQALIYQFEEYLPVAAEEIAADFLVGQKSILGICVQAEKVKPYVDALESSGLLVEHLIPTALLGLQAWLQTESNYLDFDALLLASGGGGGAGGGEEADLFHFNDGVVGGWHLLTDPASELVKNLKIRRLELSRPVRLAVVAGAASAIKDIDPHLAIVMVQDANNEVPASTDDANPVQQDPAGKSGSPLLLAAKVAQQILALKHSPLIDLRRGALAAEDSLRLVNRPLKRAAAALAVCLIALAAVMFVRAHHYSAVEEDYLAKQQALFRGMYPGKPVPPDVHIKLETEAARWQGLSGQSLPTAQQGSALLVVYEGLRRLPTEVRYRILDLRFGPEEFYLEGQAASHGDADLIAAALRKQKGFTVDPPRTEMLAPAPAPGFAAPSPMVGRSGVTAIPNPRVAGGVSFTISGKFMGIAQPPSAQPVTKVAAPLTKSAGNAPAGRPLP